MGDSRAELVLQADSVLDEKAQVRDGQLLMRSLCVHIRLDVLLLDTHAAGQHKSRNRILVQVKRAGWPFSSSPVHSLACTPYLSWTSVGHRVSNLKKQNNHGGIYTGRRERKKRFC